MDWSLHKIHDPPNDFTRKETLYQLILISVITCFGSKGVRGVLVYKVIWLLLLLRGIWRGGKVVCTCLAGSVVFCCFSPDVDRITVNGLETVCKLI